MPAAYYDFFRKVVLQPDNITLEADSTSDTLTITGGDGVALNPNATNDSFTIDVDYQLYVPIGTTEIRLNDVNSNHTGVSLVAGSNITIGRNNNNEITITSTVGGTSKSISNISQTNPVVVTTSSGHSFTEGIAVTITDVSGMTEVNGNEYYMNILTSTSFALYEDANLTTPLNGTGFTAYSTGGVATAEYGAPQSLTQLGDVDFVSNPPVNGSYLQYNGSFWGIGTTLSGDFIGSVFADDSTLLVDGVNGSIPYSVLSGAPTNVSAFTNDSAYLTTVAFNDLTAKPTTLSGYGITDAATSAQGLLADTALQPGDIFDIKGSVFADDSTLLVDGVNGIIPSSVVSGVRSNQWDLAFSWGNHSLAGYIDTETDPVVGAITGIIKSDGAGNISAAIAGTDYLTSYTETSTLDDVLTRGSTSASGIDVGNSTIGNITITNNSISSDDSSIISFAPPVSFDTYAIVNSVIPSTTDASDLGDYNRRFRNIYGKLVYIGADNSHSTYLYAPSTASFSWSGFMDPGNIFHSRDNTYVRWKSTSQLVNNYSAPSGTVDVDFYDSDTHYFYQPAGALTVNFTSLPTTNNRMTNMRIVIFQGATPYIPTSIEVAGVSTTIEWQNGIVPTGTANSFDFVQFMLWRIGDLWFCLAQANSYS